MAEAETRHDPLDLGTEVFHFVFYTVFGVPFLTQSHLGLSQKEGRPCNRRFDGLISPLEVCIDGEKYFYFMTNQRFLGYLHYFEVPSKSTLIKQNHTATRHPTSTFGNKTMCLCSFNLFDNKFVYSSSLKGQVFPLSCLLFFFGVFSGFMFYFNGPDPFLSTAASLPHHWMSPGSSLLRAKEPVSWVLPLKKHI